MSIVAPYTANDLAITDAFERELMADSALETFVVERDGWVSGSGGGRHSTITNPDSGFCQFRQVGANPSEQAIADRLGWAVSYAVDIEKPVDVTPADRLVVNGTRHFEIGGILDLGHGSTQLTVIAREVG